MGQIVTLCAVVLLSFLPLRAHSAPLGQIRISLMEGEVQVRTPESGEWLPASVNTPLTEGDELWVPEEAMLELQLSDGTCIRLDHDSALEILSLDGEAAQFHLSEGRAYVYFAGRPGSVLQFETPRASLRVDDRCAFGVLLPGDDETEVSVYEGALEVESEAGSTGLSAGVVLFLSGQDEAETTPLGPSDDWERWNQQRNDRLFGEGPSSRYLPPELRPYAYDLDSAGQWVVTGEYGRVWVPAVAADHEWSPYRNGRWIWRGGDYVWVTYEPWGWAPHHFGRWAFVPRFRWCWVPPPPQAVIWGPGFVGWVRTPEYVGWVPLAPREIYYGHGDYGPHSVNVRRVKTRRFTQVYANVRVVNGCTIVRHDTFVRGRHSPLPFKPETIRREIFTRRHMSFGRPAIKPERSSYVPVVKPIPPRFLPPPEVVRNKPDAIRRARPLIRRSDQSVFRPGTAPAPLRVRPAPEHRHRPDRRPRRPPEPAVDQRGGGSFPDLDRRRGAPGRAPEEPRRPSPPSPPLPPPRGDRPPAPEPERPRREGDSPRQRDRGREENRGASSERERPQVPEAQQPVRPGEQDQPRRGDGRRAPEGDRGRPGAIQREERPSAPEAGRPPREESAPRPRDRGREEDRGAPPETGRPPQVPEAQQPARRGEQDQPRRGDGQRPPEGDRGRPGAIQRPTPEAGRPPREESAPRLRDRGQEETRGAPPETGRPPQVPQAQQPAQRGEQDQPRRGGGRGAPEGVSQPAPTSAPKSDSRPEAVQRPGGRDRSDRPEDRRGEASRERPQRVRERPDRPREEAHPEPDRSREPEKKEEKPEKTREKGKPGPDDRQGRGEEERGRPSPGDRGRR